jgi:hypothetical protein
MAPFWVGRCRFASGRVERRRFDRLMAILHPLGSVIPRRFAAWHKVVALAPLLLLAIYLPGEMMLRCRVDGLLRPACCCPEEGDSQAQDATPVARAQDCCDQELTATQRPVVVQAQTSVADMDWALVATLPGLPVAEPDRSDRTPRPIWQAQAPPGDRPPLVLLKHAFLI